MSEEISKLKEWAKNERLTDTQVAEKLGVPYKTLEKWFSRGERTQREPSEKNKQKIRRFLLVQQKGIENTLIPLYVVQEKEDLMVDKQQAPLVTTRSELSQYKTPHKTFPVLLSGDVKLNKLEVEVVDTKDFRRLHGLKQLGTTYLVYPSATHTRFEHSLGVLGCTITMIRRIRENPLSSDDEQHVPLEDEILARLLALLHDIGHVPFGHTLEDECCVLRDKHDIDKERIERFIGKDSEIGRKLVRGLGNDLYERLCVLLTTEHKNVDTLEEHAYIADIVKNTVCADLLDYMERDSHHCLLQIGFARRFLDYIYVSPYVVERDGKKLSSRRVVVRLWKEKESRHRVDLANELVDMLEARFTLGQAVYYHHAKCISSAMIGRAVWSAMNNERKKLIKNKLWDMTDYMLLDYLEESGEEVVSKLGSFLQERRLYKRLPFTVSREEATTSKVSRDWLGHLEEQYHALPGRRTEEENNLADLCDFQPGDVLIYCPNPDMALKSADTLVLWKGEPRPLSMVDVKEVTDRIELLNRLHRNLWCFQVFINPYSPSFGSQPQKKTLMLKALCHERFDPNPVVENVGTRLVVTDIAGQFGALDTVEKVLESTRTLRTGGRVTREHLKQLIQENVDRTKTE